MACRSGMQRLKQAGTGMHQAISMAVRAFNGRSGLGPSRRIQTQWTNGLPAWLAVLNRIVPRLPLVKPLTYKGMA